MLSCAQADVRALPSATKFNIIIKFTYLKGSVSCLSQVVNKLAKKNKYIVT